MKRLLCLVTTCTFLFTGATAWAQDEVYLRGKDKAVKGNVASETGKGIAMKDGATFPAETIDNVFYEVNPVQVRIGAYRPAFLAEKDLLDPASDAKKKKAKLDEAVKKYQEAAGKIAEPFGKRHAEYKAAVLLTRQLAEEGKAIDAGIDALKKFTSKNPDAWQIGAALQLLGRLQLDSGDFDGARTTYAAMAEANVLDDLKQEAQLQVIQVSIRAGKIPVAKQGLAALLQTLKEPKHLQRARVVEAQLLIVNKDHDNAIKILRDVTKQTNDRLVKAMAYNALGVCLFEKEDYKGARWEFLWVDVEYNQDKNEHAKALYYLWKTFEQIGDAEKSQDCRELLLNEQVFAASEWRARLQKEYKAP